MQTEVKDPIETPGPPERVHYEIGTLLAAEDFRDEQSYHRGRLALALSALHGGGTVAGLKVTRVPAAPNRDEELHVSAGVAIDRLGRLVEVPRTWCLRLQRWYDAQPAAKLRAAYQGGSDSVVCDLYIRFASCEYGRTPSFARTTFDSLNATAPARERDAFEIELIPRAVPALPVALWESVPPGANADAVKSAILDAQFGGGFDGRDWAPLPEHSGGVHPLNIFLARVSIPADAPVGEARPVRRGADFDPDNMARRFVCAPSLLARLAGL